MPRYELAVLEGRWFDKKNRSIRPVFDTLIDLLHGTPHAYFYHQFSNAASLGHLIRRVAETEARFLYIGTHGDTSGLYGFDREEGDEKPNTDDVGKISRTRLRKLLWTCWDEGVGDFDGLFLGSCSFVNEENAKLLLRGEGVPASLKWVAGYATDVDWIDSTLLDALFLKRVLTKSGKSPVARIEDASRYIAREAPGLCKRLGFQVYRRKHGPGNDVKPLVEYE